MPDKADSSQALPGMVVQEGRVGDFLALLSAGDADAGLVGSREWLLDVVSKLQIPVYTTDVLGRLTYFNEEAARLAGHALELGRGFWRDDLRMLHPDGRPLAFDESAMATALRERRSVGGIEGLIEKQDGSRIPFLAYSSPLYDGQGLLAGAVKLLVDISARKAQEHLLVNMARRDALTGLPNRDVLSVEFSSRLQQARASGLRFAVMRFDLDFFQNLNSRIGHALGDEVIRRVAARLTEAAAQLGATVGHVGGDEFGIVTALSADTAEFAAAADLLHKAIESRIELGAATLAVGATAGCAIFPQDGESEAELVGNANLALYRGKSRMRGRVEFFDAVADGIVRDQQALQQDLALAIENEEIELHYQPVFGAASVLAGFEALARWTHPQRGAISPSEFIPLAESSGLVLPLSDLLLRKACREAASWSNPLRIAVNISPLQFRDGDLPGLIDEVLRESGLAPERLELEITEGVMITDFDRAMLVLHRIKALGVRIALDDFGTGYSSLSYLHVFPLTTLKIDRSFVANLGVASEAAAIARAVISLGHALGIEVVAEGVETREQLDFLFAEGCNFAQGYLLGRPRPPSDYAQLMGRSEA